MDLKDIQELIKFVAKSGATEVELEIDNVKISIKSPPKKRRGSADEAPLIINQEQSQIAPTGVIPIQTVQQNIIPVETPSSAISTEIKESTDHLVTIKSSMIGTFYRSSSPEKPSFVNVGDNIEEGDTICIIEAMKLFNEIESEISGKIIKVLVDDATPVEFDQPLFLVDPS
jgi:acetyl-CoA carboxylase biotin carboxyl carrier protein